MQIKYFHFHEPINVEAKISEWLDENPAIVIEHVNQTESFADKEKWSLSISIFYSTKP